MILQTIRHIEYKNLERRKALKLFRSKVYKKKILDGNVVE
jgi:hypothetical protein